MRNSSVVAALGVALVAALTLVGVPAVVDVLVALAVIAGVLAAAALQRRALEGDRERFALIRGAALIVDTELTVDEVVERMTQLLTPGYASTCEIDLQATEAPAHRPHALTVPLRSRGRDMGTMRLTATHRTYARGGAGVRAAARRPRRARAGERRPVRPPGARRDAPDGGARQPRRRGHDPRPRRPPDLRQPHRRHEPRVRHAPSPARHLAAGHRGRLRLLHRGRRPARARAPARPRRAPRRDAGPARGARRAPRHGGGALARDQGRGPSRAGSWST